MTPDVRRLRRAGWIAAVATLAIACGGKSPTEPPPAAAEPVSLTIGGMRSPLVVGESIQLTATLSYSDGSTRDVTREVEWFTNAGIEVATITEHGVLTAVRAGFGTVHARYFHSPQNIGAKVVEFQVNAAPPPVPEIRGVVHEASPRPGLALAGVRVEIENGPYAGQATTTDYWGIFQFFGIKQAGFDLMASKRGYESTRYRIAELPRDRAPDIQLPGPFDEAFERLTGTFAPQCYENRLAILTRSFFFTPGRDGVLTIARRINTEEQSVNPVDGSIYIVPDRPSPPEQYSARGGVRYELRVQVNGCRPSPPMDGSFQIDLSYPR